MASDRQQFQRAFAKWETLKRANSLSLPVGFGHTAIISSSFTDEEPDTFTGITELESFRSEALALADRVLSNGGLPEVAIDATRTDFDQLVQDPNVSNMYIIGNGSLSTLLLGERNYYDWADAASVTTHLKQGIFVQRQCGGLTRQSNVPLGLFIVSDPRNVHAAMGAEFYPKSLDDPENNKIKPVFEETAINYESIKALSAMMLLNTVMD